MNPFFSKILVFIGLIANMVSSIAIIQINKYIYLYYKLPNMTLVFLNFIMTFIGLLIFKQFNLFKMVKIPLKKMIPMSVSFCCFVVLTNFSLEFNSVGTYQCIKGLTTPGVLLISMIFYKQKYSTKVKLTVLPVLIGIFLNSMYDLKFSDIGLIIGLIGALITSLYQVWIGEKQKELGINALQLLIYQAPLSAIVLAFVIPFFEPVFNNKGLFDFQRSNMEWIFIIVSGLMAFFVNVSIYWIIGTTSALTYNMVGNVKFSLIIAVGYILFKDPIKYEQAFAITLVMLGKFKKISLF
jgi:solute carrier family 35 protein E3